LLPIPYSDRRQSSNGPAPWQDSLEAAVRFQARLVLRGGPNAVSKVCRSVTEALSTLEQWRTAMLERGWNVG
jgi:hypothetical protein